MGKRWQGASWTPTDHMADMPDGLWCQQCKTRHGYMSMGLAYDKRQGSWYMAWYCKKTNDILKEVKLG